jgi:hypothetical protein
MRLLAGRFSDKYQKRDLIVRKIEGAVCQQHDRSWSTRLDWEQPECKKVNCPMQHNAPDHSQTHSRKGENEARDDLRQDQQRSQQ